MSREFPIVFTPQLGGVLKEFRKLRGMTQADLAASVATTQRIVSLVEADPSGSRFETVHKLCAALGLEIVIRPRSGGESA